MGRVDGCEQTGLENGMLGMHLQASSELRLAYLCKTRCRQRGRPHNTVERERNGTSFRLFDDLVFFCRRNQKQIPTS
jgi:hypothetical protein